MDGLRWLLLLFGLLFIGGVYWFSRRDAAGRASLDGRKEPSLEDVLKADDAGSVDEVTDSETDGEEDTEPAADDSVEPPPEKVVTLRMVAANRGTLAGDDLALGMRGIGMRHGKFGIFHRFTGDDSEHIVFSAASLVEPGTFDLANLKDQRLPGISLFLVLPGPMDGAEAFDLMMNSARTLAKSLGAELLDESGSTLSIQRERYLREEIIQYQHGIKVA